MALPWPAGLAPKPQELADEPDVADPLPRADVLVVTWTAAEMLALADTLTPGVNPRTRWYRYARNFEEYLPEIRGGAPARAVGRLGSYYPTRIGSKSVLCVKSELHLNQDGVATGAGTATMPVARFLKQIYQEVQAAARHHRRHRRWHVAQRRAGRRDDHPHGEVQVHEGVPQRAVRHHGVHVGGDDPAQAPGGGGAR